MRTNKQWSYNRFSFALVVLFAVLPLFKVNAQLPNKTRILFLMDASGSMYATMGSDNRINIAKRLLSKMIDSLKQTQNLEIGLRIYGHQSSKDKQNCKDTRLEIPFGKNNHDAMKLKLQGIKPLGTTLIAYSLQEAAYDFPADNRCRNIVILITDGLEECNGDPCAISEALQRRGVILRPFIIGVGLSKDYAEQFECIGRYFDATTEEGFDDVLKVVISQALNNTTIQVNLLDENKRPLETDVNMTFYDHNTGKMTDNFVHTLNTKGLPDTLSLDPVNSYDIYVHTLPPVKKENIVIQAGKHNIVSIDAPQGALKLKVNGVTNYNRLQCIVKKAGTHEIINVQDFNTVDRYITGLYDIEILSTPRILEKNVKINQSVVTAVEIDQPGKLNFNTRIGIVGAIYKYNPKTNLMEWVINMNSTAGTQIVILQPGKYKMICRGNSDKRIMSTKRVDFEIKSGQVTPLNIL